MKKQHRIVRHQRFVYENVINKIRQKREHNKLLKERKKEYKIHARCHRTFLKLISIKSEIKKLFRELLALKSEIKNQKLTTSLLKTKYQLYSKKRKLQFKTNLYIPAMYSKLTPYLPNDLQVQLLR